MDVHARILIDYSGSMGYINTQIDFYHSVINYLGDDNLIRNKITKSGTESLDFGTKICFVLMSIFIYFLLISIKFNRYKN